MTEVDEMIVSFTHTQEMPWMLPGIAPTHRRIEVPLAAIVRFREGRLTNAFTVTRPPFRESRRKARL